MDVISLISSELNCPPLSVINAPITPNFPIQCVMKLSITLLGFFLSMNIDNVYLDLECVCVCVPILVTTFPEWLSGTEPLPHTPGAVRPSLLCL